MPIQDLILRFERSCRNVSESIRYGSNIQLRVVEDKLMRQKAQLLLDEAASWSLLWVLGMTILVVLAGTEEPPEDHILLPSASHIEACQFVVNDHTAQLCLRIVQWLEGLASKALDLESKVISLFEDLMWVPIFPILEFGTIHNFFSRKKLPVLTLFATWILMLQHTNMLTGYLITRKWCLKHKTLVRSTLLHYRNQCLFTFLLQISNLLILELVDLQYTMGKLDESLFEDVWTLLTAGRLEEACELCRSAGQPWRVATLCPFGGMDLFPSVEALKISEQDGGKYETAVYAAQCSNLKHMLPICTDWESACWAMARSWLDVQVDLELAHSQPGRMEQLKSYGDDIEGNSGQMSSTSQPVVGPDSWPLQVLNQQPRGLSSLLQKLHSGASSSFLLNLEKWYMKLLLEGARSSNDKLRCKEIELDILIMFLPEMKLMLGNIPHLLELLWSWISPSEDDQNVFRYLLTDEMKNPIREELMIVGDHIIRMYAMFLFSKQHEELVGIYSSQLARHRCIDLFVHMMELRLNSSVHVKYKIFLSAMGYLPFSPGDDSKGSLEEIIERVLSRSREIKPGKYDKVTDVAEQHWLQSLQKAMVIQWLCFTPPSTIADFADISAKLLMRALIHSNILFREFALISMWRVPAMPIGAHALLSFLAEPLKQLSETPDTLKDYVSEDLKEFQEWREFYSCDATYWNWLKIELENADVSELLFEEKQRLIERY
ncbi:hypothetical protein Pint_29212 [Pistacia integerrima]|uniref:Uncharacterized protein n=1 Tax=Pistacia integerrima TaxID=434235 RepID=A0ACC0WXT5_9ROSI|nr:hypothetical protein Pint_29212 [Pistacia integerrima]